MSLQVERGKFHTFDRITIASVIPEVQKTCDKCLQYAKELLPFCIKMLWKYKHIESGINKNGNLVLELPLFNLDLVIYSLSPSVPNILHETI